MGHRSDAIGFRYSHAGDLLVSTCWDGTLRLWDPKMGQQLFNSRFLMQTFRFSPDDHLLAAEISDTKLRLLEVATPSWAYSHTGGRPFAGTCVAQ